MRPLQHPVESGNVLLSRAVSSQVPSALRGLTSVFGMGTGGSLSLLSPEIFRLRAASASASAFFQLLLSLASAFSSFRFHSLPLSPASASLRRPRAFTTAQCFLLPIQGLQRLACLSLSSRFPAPLPSLPFPQPDSALLPLRS